MIVSLDIFLFIAVLVSLSLVSEISTQNSLYANVYGKCPGDIFIGGLFSMHHQLRKNGTICGSIIEQDGLQVFAAARYGIELVNNMSILPFRLGLLALDTCQDSDYMISQSMEFLQFKMKSVETKYKCLHGGEPTPKAELESFHNIFGIFGAPNSDVSMATSMYLKLIRLPQLSYFSTSTFLSDRNKYPWFFRTIPSDEYSIKALIVLLRLLKWNYVMILKDSSEYSKQITDTFIKQISNSTAPLPICVNKVVKIDEDNPFRNVIKEILLKDIDKPFSKIILTFLSQPVVEEFLGYIQENPNESLGNFMWIATDSWGGRNWPNLNNAKVILRNIISVVPRAYVDENFMRYYTSQLPSKSDSDPWLALKFETTCNCQYTNTSLFILTELKKIRNSLPKFTSCESLEINCAKNVYKDLKQMLYIHYVIDGILVYAHTLRNLIPQTCWSIKEEECRDLLWKSQALKIPNITREMSKIKFNDSTGEIFEFWNGQDGIPRYSIVKYSLLKNTWVISGNISETLETQIDNSFFVEINESISISSCSEECPPRHAKHFLENRCCWECQKCSERSFINIKNSTIFNIPSQTEQHFFQEECVSCNETTDLNNNTCINRTVIFMSFQDPIAVSLILLNMFGLLSCMTSLCVIVIYWKTPIINIFGKETSCVLLFGTMLSFGFSTIILDKPQNWFCIIRWCSPGFCMTVCYASILVKINRIAGIFGVRLSSTKIANPRFITPLSQMLVIMIITTVEVVILIVVMIFSNLGVQIKDSTLISNCVLIHTSALLVVFLIPLFLLISSTAYAFKIRDTPDGFNETRNLNFINFANCVVFTTCLVLVIFMNDDRYSALPFALLLTMGGHGNLLGLFFPKVYVILFRPSKNTISDITDDRSRRVAVFQSKSPSISSGPDSDNTIENSVICRRCNFRQVSTEEIDQLAKDRANNENIRKKSKSKVNFADSPNNVYVEFTDSPNIDRKQVDNQSFEFHY